MRLLRYTCSWAFHENFWSSGFKLRIHKTPVLNLDEDFMFCWPYILLQSLQITNLTHNSFSYICLFQFSTCFEQPSVHHQESTVSIWSLVYVTLCRWPCGMQVYLHTTRSPTYSDIYQRSYWYSWLSWWWALGCSKHVENWNKQIYEKEVKLVIYKGYIRIFI